MVKLPGFGGFFSFTTGVAILLVLHLAGLFLILLSGDGAGGPFLRILGLVPASVVEGFALWQLATYSFPHPDVGSLIGVLFIFFFFGVRLEKEWGFPRFLTLYFTLSAITGVARMLPELGSTAPLIGTLGVSSGILAAFAETFRHERAWFFGGAVNVRVLVYAMIAIAALSSFRQPLNLLWFTGVPAGIIFQRLMTGRSLRIGRRGPKPTERFSSLDLEE